MSRTIVVHYTWDHSALHALSRRSASLSLSSFTIRWRWINSAGQTQTSGEDNACVCRDAHLGPGDLKIWRLPILHFTLHTPPPPNVNSPTRPPIRPAHKLTQPLWLRTSYEGLTHYMRSLVMTKWSLSVTKCVQKCPKNRTMNQKGSNFEEKNGL